jgi:hypothetical protein
MPTRRKFRRNNNRKSRRRGKRGGEDQEPNNENGSDKAMLTFVTDKNGDIIKEMFSTEFFNNFNNNLKFDVNYHANTLRKDKAAAKAAAKAYANEFYFKWKNDDDQYTFPSKNLKITVTPAMINSYNLKKEGEGDQISYEELVKQMTTRYYEAKKKFLSKYTLKFIGNSKQKIENDSFEDIMKTKRKKAFMSMCVKDIVLLAMDQHEKAEAASQAEGATPVETEGAKATRKKVKDHFSKFGELGTYNESDDDGWLDIGKNFFTAPWVQVVRGTLADMRGIMFGIWMGIIGGKYGGGDHGFGHKDDSDTIENHVSARINDNKLDLTKILNFLQNINSTKNIAGGKRRRRKRRTKRGGKSRRRKRRTKRRRRRKTR